MLLFAKSVFGGFRKPEKGLLMSSKEIVIDVKSLSKRYEIYATPRDRLKQFFIPSLYRMLARVVRLFFGVFDRPPPQYFCEFWALKGVSFQVKKGETLGILGRNGSGKSTLLQIICSTLSPTSGDVDVKGRISALLELGSGFNPEYTGRENVLLNGQILGLSQTEIESRYESIVEFADIGEFIDRPVKTYSSGMAVRLAFAVAINVDPEILVIDEALAVGDVAFQRKCMAWLESYVSQGGTLIFVSHSTEQVRRLCNRAVYLRNGEMVYYGEAKIACDRYEKDAFLKLPVAVIASDEGPPMAKENQAQFLGDTRRLNAEFPKCASHYGGMEATILDAWTEDSVGNVTQDFCAGDSFFWCYRVLFNKDSDRVSFGMMVKTVEGLNLCSLNSKTLGLEPSSYKAGSLVLVRFDVSPKLGGGVYYLNCGVSSENHEGVHFLYRVVDAGVFNVKPVSEKVSGLIDMSVCFQHSVIEEPL